MAYAGKISGGVQGYGRPRSRSGGGTPLTPENFRKFAKKFLKKIAKNAVFSPILQKKFENLALNFRAFGRKTQLAGEILKIIEIF